MLGEFLLRESRLTGAVQASYRARFAARDILSLFDSLPQKPFMALLARTQ